MIEYSSEISRIFQEDVIGRKRIASSVSSNKMITRKIWFPSDTMNRREKCLYRRSGKVSVFNMYDKLISKEEFYALPEADQKKYLSAWLKLHSRKKIYMHIGMSDYKFTKLIYKLGIGKRNPDDKSSKKKSNLRAVNAPQTQAEVVQMIPIPTVKQELADTLEAMRIAYESQHSNAPSDGFSITYKGEYSSKQVQDKLLKIAQMIEGEESNYHIEISIKELPTKTQQE